MRKMRIALALVVSAFMTCFTQAQNVAKVGNTEYATIDAAIAAWTNNTTLTLLADVTLSDVIKLSSTEYHILDLGTYTMTAAKNKNAIEYVVKGRTSASYALDIKADATNPGGINASGKAIVVHMKPTSNAPEKDRPITRFYGGIFTASNIVKQYGVKKVLIWETDDVGYSGAAAPHFYFYGGEFNGTIYTNRSKNIFYGGTFNGNLQMSVDTSADALIVGGKFKSLSNLFGSTLNTDKFTIGSAAGVYDRGIYVDKEGYYVITSAPITEVSAKYPAVKKESYNSNNYFYYSAAAKYGMFYEVASMAGTGSNVTLYTPKVSVGENVTVPNGVSGNLAVEEYDVVVPDGVKNVAITVTSVEGTEKVVFTVEPKNEAGDKVSEPTSAITFRLPVPAAWAGFAKVSHDDKAMGVYEIKEENGGKYVEVSSDKFSEFAVELAEVELPGDDDKAASDAFGANTVFDGTNYYATLQAAVEAVCGTNGAMLYCKPGADVGSLMHAPVTATLTIYGNGAYVSGGSERDFDIGNTDPNGGRDITADMTLTVKDLEGCGAWGAKATDHTVNLVFEDCQNMGKVYISGTTGTLNITIKDSAFEGVLSEAVYANANGVIALTNVDFSNLTKAVNLNHKAAGTQTVTITDCSFTNCGSDVLKDQIPVRVLSSVDGGKSVLTVSGTTFTGTPEGGADILLDYGVGVTEASVSGTAANVAVEKTNNVATTTTTTANAPAIDFTNVVTEAMIGETKYKTFAEALSAAAAMTGDVTVKVLEKVTLNGPLSGSYASIKFVGEGETAEIYLDVQGYVEAAGKKVAFEDLKLSKVAGGYITNAGFMNLAFGIFGATEVACTNCTFLNGAYASSGTNTFTGCTFYRSHDRYGLWAYGAANIVVDGCTFADIRGIKMYDEGKAGTTNITVKNTDFTAADNKPAIVLTYGQSVTLENNTYSSKGVFELDLDGAPNGVTVTSDVPPTCINDNGACGVLVDGKIYTTVAQAAEVATANSTVTLLHNSAETVVLPIGVTLNKNNFEAAGITVAQPVAKIGEKGYASLTAALETAQAGDTITLLTNVEISDSILLDKSLTLDLGGNTITSTNNRSIKINTSGNAAEEIVIKNGTVISTPDAGRCIQLMGDALERLELNGVTFKAEKGQSSQTITLAETNSTKPLEFVVKNSTVVASNNNGYACIFFCPIDATIENSTISGYAALYFKNAGVANTSEGSVVDVIDSNLIGTNVQGGKNTFGTITTEANNVTINVSGGSITANKTNDALQTIVYCGWYAGKSTGLVASLNTELLLGDGCRILDEFEDLSVQTVSVRAAYAQYLKDAGYATQDVEGESDLIQILGPAVAKIGDTSYATLSAAFAAVTDDNQTVTILKDVTEELTGAYLRGNITTENDAKVTITLTNSDWVYCPYTFVLGANITLNVPYLFYYAGGSQINGTVITGAYYQRYAGTKLTINEPGSMTVTTEMFYLRYTDGDANAGIYINGDNNDETIGLKLAVAYFYQGMISAKDANLQVGTYWQTNETDGQGSANLVLDNSILTVSVYDYPAKATGNSTVTLKNGSTMNCQNGDFVAGDNAKVAVDSSSSIIGKNGPIEFGLAGSGTETAPYVIASVDDLVLFRDSVNKGETKYNASGVWVALGANIDLASVANWEPIGNWDASFDANFDGKGYKIQNLKMSDNVSATGESYLGFFGITANNTIKNLTIENVTISSEGQIVAAAIAYPYYTTVSDITVCGDIAIKGGNYTAGVLAYTRLCKNASNLTVSGNAGSTITGAQVVGGVIADIQMNKGLTAVYSNFSAENLTITGTSMVGGISGIIATQTLSGATVKNVTIVCSDRAGQVAGSFGGTCTISNIVVENVTGADVIIGGGYKGAAPVQAKIGDTFYATFADAYAAAQAGDTITLLADISSSAIIVLDKAITLDGNGKTLTSTAGRAINVSGANGVTIKNLTINASGERAINIIQNATNVTIDNVTAAAANYTVNVASSAPNAVVAIKNSTLNGLCTVNVSAAGAQVTVQDSTVNCNDNNTTAGESYAALSLNKEAVGGSIIATNTTVNVPEDSDSKKGRNGAENGTVTINDSTDGVVVMVAVITYEGSDYYHAFASLQSAIEFAKAGDTIKLIRDVTASEIITINKAITLDGNGKKLTSTAGRAINVSGANGVTIKNLTINASGERAINIIQNATNVTIDNVTATAANYTVNVASSAPNAVVAIKNSNLTGLNVVNVAAAGANVTITGGKLTCNDQNAGEGYSALVLNKDAKNGTITATGVTFDVKGDSAKATNQADGGTVTIDGSTDGVDVDVACIFYEGNYWYGFTSLDAAIKKAKAGDTITLIRDVTATEVILIDKNLTINGNGHKVTSSATRVFRVTTSGVEVTMNDVNVASTAKVVYPNDVRGIAVDPSLTNVKLTLNKCSVDFTDTTANDWAYAVNVAGNGTGHTITVNGGTYEGANVINVYGANNTVVIKDATLNSTYPKNDQYYGACVWVLQNQGSSVEATGNTFNGSNAVAFNLGTGTALTESNNTDNTVRCLLGDGSADKPYLIEDVKQLVLFRDSVNAGETKYNAPGKWVALGADIDLAGVDWSVNIGDDCNATFDGVFDGKSHTIKNLTSTETAQKGDVYICTGLFGAIYGSAQIKNLTLENVTIDTATYTGNNVGALVGFAYNCTGTIDNVTVKNVKINATNATGVGAIVGYDYYSPALKVTNCTVDGTSIKGAAYVGGVVGYASTKIQLNNNTVKNLTLSGTASVGGVAGIMLAGGSASGNTIDTVTLSATGAMWANSVGAVAGTMTNGSITVAGTTVTGSNVTDIVGGILVEKPTTPIKKVQAQIGDTFYTDVETARKDAEKLDETLVATGGKTGDKTGVDAFNTMYLLGGSFKKTAEGTLHYDYAFGVSNVTYVGGTTGKPFKVTIAIKDADSTADRELTGRTLVLRMVVKNEDGTIAKEVVEPIEDPEFKAVDGQVTCDVFVALPADGEGKATYFTVNVTDEK